MSIHCTSCGAPIKNIDSQGAFRCGHCGTAQGPSQDVLTNEGLVLSGHDEELGCPLCEVPLQRGKIKDDTPVLGCSTCHGYLLSHVEFGALVRYERANYQGADVMPSPIDDAARSRRVRCPGCGERMEAYFYAGPGNAFIDGCSPCGQLWLDAGELQRIIAAPGLRGNVPARRPVAPARLAPTDGYAALGLNTRSDRADFEDIGFGAMLGMLFGRS